METYQEKRQKVIDEFIKEKKELEELSHKNAGNIRSAYDNLRGTIDSIFDLEEELTKYSEKIKRVKNSTLGGSKLDAVKGLIGVASTEDVQRAYNAFLKRTIQGHELKLKNLRFFILSGFKEGARSVRSSVSFRRGYATAVNCESELREIIVKLEENDLLDANNLFNILKSLETKQAIKSLESLAVSLEGYNPSVSAERIRMKASLNMQNLCAQLNSEKSAKKEYIHSLEGRVLAYVTYSTAAKREEEIGTEDIEYFSFLEAKRDEKLSSLCHESHETLKTLVETLEDKELISEDEASYALVHIRKLYEKNLPAEVKEESQEDIRLRTLILEEDFDIPFNQSFNVAKMIKDEDVQRVYQEIAGVAGFHNAKLLIHQNPDLFLLDNGNIGRYTAYLKSVLNDARRYAGTGDTPMRKLSLEDNPSEFASFEALHQTQERISNLENTVLDAGNGNEWQILISTRALERAEKDTFITHSKEKYTRMIRELSKYPTRTSRVERIGEFNVFPAVWNGRKSPRIAFHLNKSGKILFIDDLLYHVRQYEYVDSWNSRASDEINIEHYSSKGYQEFKGKI